MKRRIQLCTLFYKPLLRINADILSWTTPFARYIVNKRVCIRLSRCMCSAVWPLMCIWWGDIFEWVLLKNCIMQVCNFLSLSSLKFARHTLGNIFAWDITPNNCSSRLGRTLLKVHEGPCDDSSSGEPVGALQVFEWHHCDINSLNRLLYIAF